MASCCLQEVGRYIVFPKTGNLPPHFLCHFLLLMAAVAHKVRYANLVSPR